MILNRIKVSFRSYLSKWDFTRIFRLLLGAGLFTGYFSTGETIYLLGGAIFSLQALLNIGCPGGSCETKTKKPDSQVIEFKKLETDKQQDV